MANEKRLGNTEAIARKLKNAHCAECNVVRQIQCSACWVNDVLDLLEDGTVDAVEVVHGHWIETEEGTICSECNKHPFEDGEFAIANYNGNYCPNCGADMRERINNEEVR